MDDDSKKEKNDKPIVVQAETEGDSPSVEEASETTVVATQYQYQGPLPHPDHLEQYERILPGAAERFFKMLEKEQDHRLKIAEQENEREEATHAKIVDTVMTNEKRGQYMGFIISIFVLITAIILAFKGSPASGAGLGVAVIAGLTSIFWKMHNRSKNNDNDDSVESE